MDMTQNKCCRHGANLRRKRRRRRKIRHSVIFLCSSIAVIVFVAVESRMITSGDGGTNKYDVEAGNNTYDNAVIENSKISEKNKIQNNQSMLDDIMNSTQYPKQLKDLALKNEEALEFVYDYPAEHVKEHTIDLTEEASMDSVPLFVQWDKRWGYEKYSGNFFAASGCGPTTLSMVVVYLTHNREASPIAVAKYSKEAGYSVDGSGSSWTLISEGCMHYGVKAKAEAKAAGLTPNEVIIMASIVDQETANSEEKPMVAGMYLNRLHQGMKLQADPTVKFALKQFALKRILHEHLSVDSPYNTYRHEGLPPGPIAIPALSSIEAVLHFAHHDYIYMCAKEDFSGTHNFAKTYEEHLANARKYAEALNERGIK